MHSLIDPDRVQLGPWKPHSRRLRRLEILARGPNFNFSTNDQPDLAVQISSITALNTNSTDPITLQTTPITTYLDSTIPYMYLPLSTCDLFEDTFGLTYNTTTQLSTISTTQHTLLLAPNPNITFALMRPDSWVPKLL
jgi:hypothetical protein